MGRLWRARVSRRAALAHIGATGLGAIALASCGDDDSSKSTATTAAASPSAPAATASAASTQPATAAASPTPADFLSRLPENPPDPTAEKDFKSGGRAVRLFNREASYDVITSVGPAAACELVLPTVNRMLRLSNRASDKSVMAPTLEGDLATAWETPDATTVVFTLAPNVKFQNVKPLNGRTLTVDDIKFSFNRGKTHQKSAWKNYFNLVQSIDDVGGGKVKFTLSRPYPAILQALALHIMFIMPPEIGSDDAVAASTAVGTGPFIMSKHTPNVETVYDRNPDYFKTDSAGHKRPYMDGYTLSNIADSATLLALLQSGKADSTFGTANPITVDNAEAVSKANANLVFQRHAAAYSAFMMMGHSNKAPWSDVRVRQALSLSLDRDSIIKSLFKSQASVGPFFPWPYLFDTAPGPKELGPYYAYDPAQAKQLLSAAGMSNLELQLDWYDISNMDQQLLLWQQSAAAAGIKLTLVKSPDAVSHFRKQGDKSWPGLLLGARGLDFVDPSAIMSYYLAGNPLNVEDVNDPELEQLNPKLESSTGDARKAIARQIFDRLNTAAFDVTLPASFAFMAYSSRLHNWRDTSWGANSGYGSGSVDQVWLSA